MTVQWQISTGTNRVELADGRGEVTFTVANPGPVDVRATVSIEGSEQTKQDWFNVAEPQRTVPHGGSVPFTAQLTVGANAPPGTHWLAARVYAADSTPEESSVLSDRVSFEVAAPKPKPKPPVWLWLVIGGVLLAAVIGVVLFVVLSGGTPVPKVVGLDKAAATKALDDAGLKPVEKTANSDTVLSGVVISQNPAPETEVDDGTPVTITVSLGKLVLKVPAGLIGATFEDAEAKLREAGLGAGLELENSSQTKGRVVRTAPGEGEDAASGRVTLVVSIGPSGEPPPTFPPFICITKPKLCDRVIDKVREPVPFTLPPEFTRRPGPGG